MLKRRVRAGTKLSEIAILVFLLLNLAAIGPCWVIAPMIRDLAGQPARSTQGITNQSASPQDPRAGVPGRAPRRSLTSAALRHRRQPAVDGTLCPKRDGSTLLLQEKGQGVTFLSRFLTSLPSPPLLAQPLTCSNRRARVIIDRQVRDGLVAAPSDGRSTDGSAIFSPSLRHG